MKSEIESAIKYLAGKVESGPPVSHEAMQYAQAALNLAHTLQAIKQTEEK